MISIRAIRHSAGPVLAVFVATAAAVALIAPAAAESEPAAASAISSGNDLKGRVFAWHDGGLQPIDGAHVSTGTALVRTNSNGEFRFDAADRTGALSVVRAGYDVVRRDVQGDYQTIILRELIVRAIFVDFDIVTRPDVQQRVHKMVSDGLINTIVTDIKHTEGYVFDFAATDEVKAIRGSTDSGNMLEFLDELDRRGVYLIGRVVSFLDNRYPRWYPHLGLHNSNWDLFIDNQDLTWSNALIKQVRDYNLNIAIKAAPYFDEIQFDYVRFPYEGGLIERHTSTHDELNSAIGALARDAADALHLVGAAVAFDTFGIVGVATQDQGIGQAYEYLLPYLDYVSPMVYPSGWEQGYFGLYYPPEHPRVVVERSVAPVTERAERWGSVLVRPWLQDFRDYGVAKLPYNTQRVKEQIEGSAAAGAAGFMLWDPRLDYQELALEITRDLEWNPARIVRASAQAADGQSTGLNAGN